jgi:hypothetical protein
MKVLVRRMSILSAMVALGAVLVPAAAHAATTMSASAYGWGATWGTAVTAAQTNAYWALYDKAAALGETCTGVTYSNVNLYYVVPGGGGDVFTATATGSCG